MHLLRVLLCRSLVMALAAKAHCYAARFLRKTSITASTKKVDTSLCMAVKPIAANANSPSSSFDVNEHRFPTMRTELTLASGLNSPSYATNMEHRAWLSVLGGYFTSAVCRIRSGTTWKAVTPSPSLSLPANDRPVWYYASAGWGAPFSACGCVGCRAGLHGPTDEESKSPTQLKATGPAGIAATAFCC